MTDTQDLPSDGLSLAEHLGQLGTWEWDVLSNTVRWSSELYRIYGLDEDSFGASFEAYLARVHADDRERVQGIIQGVVSAGESFHFEERIVRPNGEVRELESVGRVSRDAEGRPLKLVGACMDVTERNAARRRERERERELALALDAARMGSWRWSTETGVVDWDDDTKRTFGREGDSFGGTLEAFMELVVEADRPLLEAQIDKAFSSEDGRYSVRHRFHLPTGEVRWAQGFGEVVRDAEGRPAGLRGLVTDVTERVELEAQFLQAQKMESVGRLAGGVAHDFNNLLTVILGELEMVKGLVPEDTPIADACKGIHEASTRAARLTRELLTLAKQQPMRAETVDLLAAVEERRDLLARMVGELVEVHVSSQGRAFPVRIDPAQLDQLLLNLVANARDAMPEGGTLDIDVSELDLSADEADEHLGVTAGRWVRLVVSDSGPGISAEILDKVLDPFFTTKETGTGLGLSTCYGIVRRHGGAIELHSEEGAGLRISILLPREEKVPGAAEATTVSESGESPRASILLVEDDDRLRALTRRTLESRGFEVSASRDGQHALAVLAECDSPFDLLLTDVVMPKLGGVPLARKVRERHDIPVVFVSGYTADAFDEGLPERAELLQKPYLPSDLEAAIRRALS